MNTVCRYLSVALLLVYVTPLLSQQKPAKNQDSRNPISKTVNPKIIKQTGLLDWLNDRIDKFNFPDIHSYERVYNRLLELENGKYHSPNLQSENSSRGFQNSQINSKVKKAQNGLYLRPENLIVQFEFDEGQGNIVNDLSGNGNNAYIREFDNAGNPRALSNSYWNNSAVQGTAIEMDGIEHTSNSIIEIPTSSTLATLTDQITVMAWVNRDIGSIVPQNGSVSNVGILTHDYPSFFFGYHNTLYKLEFFTDTGGVVSCYTPQDTLGEWNHIAGTYDGTVARLFVNGQQICSENLSGNLIINTQNGPLGAFTISGFYDVRPAPVVPYGNASGVTDELDGRIDKFKLYNAALSQAELQDIYNEELAYLQGTNIPVTGISLEPSTLDLVEGETATLSPMVIPSNATDQGIFWATADGGVAGVDSNGVVTAVGEGSTSITVTTSDGGYSASTTVTVTKPVISVTGISLEPSTLDLVEGETATLSPMVIPSNATDQGIFWATADGGVAGVDSNGLVTAVGEGSTSITVTTSDGGYSASTTVTVTKPVISVTGISLEPSTLDLVEGETATLSPMVIPSNATDQGIFWATADGGVAGVDSNGLVTAVGEGSTSITVTTSDGGYSASTTVTVTKPVISVTGISLEPSTLDLVEGETATLSPTVIPSNATDQGIFWATADGGVAGVDSNGLVTAVGEGSTSITVTTSDGGYSASTTVTVTKPVISVTGISLEPSTLDLVEGETATLSPMVIPSNATDQGIFWATADGGVAGVDSNGLVTAVGEGSTSITVTTSDGGYSASTTVTVTKPVISVTGISLEPSTLDLVEGETATLSPMVIPSNATDQGIFWATADGGVAGVDSNGLVTAVGEGSTSITVTTSDGGYSASTTVTVTKPVISVTGISLEPSTLDLVEGETATLSPTVIPSNATDQGIFWATADGGVAGVDSNGLVTAVGEGSTSITVTTSDGGYSASTTVTVTKPVISVTGISLEPSTLDLVEGETATLSPMVIPSNATDQGIFWATADGGVAGVDSNGVVTAVGEGSTSITVTTSDGGYSASTTVTVTKPVISVTGISLNFSSLDLFEGETYVLEYNILPNNATNQNVLWSSSNQNIAMVDENGKVTTITEGETIISVTTIDGEFEDTIQLNVLSNVVQSIAVESIEIDPKYIFIATGSSSKLTPFFVPYNATNQEVFWESQNPIIAIVDNQGSVLGVSPGKTKIRVTASDGGFYSEVEVEVVLNEGSKELLPTLMISPNPANNWLEIQMNKESNAKIVVRSIIIFQLNGRKAKEVNVGYFDLSRQAYGFDISNLEKGSYIIAINSIRHGVFLKRLIVTD